MAAHRMRGTKERLLHLTERDNYPQWLFKYCAWRIRLPHAEGMAPHSLRLSIIGAIRSACAGAGGHKIVTRKVQIGRGESPSPARAIHPLDNAGCPSRECHLPALCRAGNEGFAVGIRG
jgi:hypothetical protein